MIKFLFIYFLSFTSNHNTFLTFIIIFIYLKKYFKNIIKYKDIYNIKVGDK